MSPIIRHWRGKFPLWISFWLIGVLPIVLIRLFEPQWLPLVPLAKSWAVPVVLTYASIVALVLFPWQAIGIIRSAYDHFDQFGKTHILYTVQAAVIAGSIAAASHFLYTAQRLTALVDHYEFQTSNVEQKLGIARSQDNASVLMLTGDLVFGSSNDVRRMLASASGIDTVVLDSDGGQIYEGRGLALLFKEYGLHTHVQTRCSSACATAFIGGVVRTVTEGAKLGFHQYGFDANRSRQTSSTYDIDAEQRKDAALFIEQGVSPDFTDKMFDKSSAEMWFPNVEQLLDAGVIHAVDKKPGV